MSDNRAQLMDLIEKEMSAVTKRLQQNWLQQYLLVSLGTILLLTSPTDKGLQFETFGIKGLPPAFVWVAIPVLLLYTFINFGYTLNRYIRMRKISDDQASVHYRFLLSPANLQHVLERQTPFEPVYYWTKPKSTDPHSLTWVVTLSAVILPANHYMTLKMMLVHYPDPAKAICVAAASLLLLGCYFQFWRSQQHPTLQRVALGAALVAAVSMFALRLHVPAQDAVYPKSNTAKQAIVTHSPPCPCRCVLSPNEETAEAVGDNMRRSLVQSWIREDVLSYTITDALRRLPNDHHNEPLSDRDRSRVDTAGYKEDRLPALHEPGR